MPSIPQQCAKLKSALALVNMKPVKGKAHVCCVSVQVRTAFLALTSWNTLWCPKQTKKEQVDAGEQSKKLIPGFYG